MTDIRTERAAPTVGLIESGLAVQRRERETALLDVRRLRREASAEIDRLIAFLDASDEYVMTEAEEDADLEPSLSFPLSGAPVGEGNGSNTLIYDSLGRLENRELDDCDDEDNGDQEPSLGSRDHNWSQEAWAVGDRRDLEQDPGESGIADLDGLLEQVGTQSWQPGGMV